MACWCAASIVQTVSSTFRTGPQPKLALALAGARAWARLGDGGRRPTTSLEPFA